MRPQILSAIRRGVLALALVAFFCSIAQAAEVDRQTYRLKLGGSDLIKTIYPFKRISIANPAIADVVILSPKEVYIFAKQVGYTSIILWEEGKGKTLLDLVVTIDLTGLKEKIYELYPNQQIEVYGSETGVVLSGTVSGPEIVEQVLRLAASFLPKTAEGDGGQGEGGGRSDVGVTNLLKVAGTQQVMLEVKFAEVSRNSGMDWQAGMKLGKLGSDFRGAAGSGALGVTSDGNLTSLAGSTLLMNFAGNTLSGAAGAANLANVFLDIRNFTAALTFLESEGLVRTLAEPRLVTMSGQEASFLAGGEFPVPVPDENGITIEFKEFGVGLSFTPVVMSDGKISLRVAPAVSSISETQSMGSYGDYPVLTTRKLETNVQLNDGQTLALAGLLQEDLRENVRKIPGLGDIPILGALFRSTYYTEDKTDLLIAVTPHLVKPTKEGTIKYPGEDLQPPNRYQFYLEGRLEGDRPLAAPSAMPGHNFSAAIPAKEKVGGLEGEFGHQPVIRANTAMNTDIIEGVIVEGGTGHEAAPVD
jgi:pilus assembly protein CpaC